MKTEYIDHYSVMIRKVYPKTLADHKVLQAIEEER